MNLNNNGESAKLKVSPRHPPKAGCKLANRILKGKTAFADGQISSPVLCVTENGVAEELHQDAAGLRPDQSLKSPH